MDFIEDKSFAAPLPILLANAGIARGARRIDNYFN